MSDEGDHRTADAAGGPDVLCPKCGYSLRGLPGLVVRCPECGEQSYIPELIARRRRDWAETRLYNLLGNAALTLPVALGAIILPPIWLELKSPATVGIIACGAGLLGVWFGLLGRIVGSCGVIEAIRLVVLSQVLIVCFVASGLLAPIGIIVLIAMVAGGFTLDDAAHFLEWLIAVGLGVGLALGGLRFCRVLDRVIGLRCIALELRGGEDRD